ncbi:MAG: hypothetical protein JSR61_00945 [Proteobacteria bacterium]|nr:hypothetical protein [Pseudomonadota bacterium]
MRVHVLAIVALSGVIILSFAAGRVLTDYLLAAGPNHVSEAIPVSHK